jgi:hypothetical protein
MGPYLTDLDAFKVCATDLTKSIREAQCLNLVYDWIQVFTKLVSLFDVTRLRLYKVLHENLYMKYPFVLVWVEQKPWATHLEFTPIK